MKKSGTNRTRIPDIFDHMPGSGLTLPREGVKRVASFR